MPVKPSYEELEQKVKDLENDVKYRYIFENIQDIYYEASPDGKILEVSPSVEKLSGYRREQVIGKSIYELYVTPAERDEVFKELLRKGRVNDYEVLLKDANGEKAYCAITARLIRDRGGNPEKIIGSLRNITDRKEAEEKIHWLSQELIRAQENERRRISRELHDRVAQDLSTAKILADQILLSDTGATLPEVRREISNISGALQGVIHAVRNLAYDLRPPALDDMGLVQTIFQYCEEFSERTGLNIEFSSAGLESAELDSDTEINVYRLIQEGLNNVQKHAEARRVTVKLVRAFPNIILRIEDDGKGFDVHARRMVSPNEKRMGLQSMEERVHLLQGKMEIQSRPMQGTKISIRIPSKEVKRES